MPRGCLSRFSENERRLAPARAELELKAVDRWDSEHWGIDFRQDAFLFDGGDRTSEDDIQVFAQPFAQNLLLSQVFRMTKYAVGQFLCEALIRRDGNPETVL